MMSFTKSDVLIEMVNLSPTSLVRRVYGQLSICDLTRCDFSVNTVSRVKQFVKGKCG
jgi:hypothetical protein